MDYFFFNPQANREQAFAALRQEHPTATIYFDACSEEDYEGGAGDVQPRLFWNRGKPANREQTIIVVIQRGEIWFLRPTGDVQFSAPYTNVHDQLATDKVMPVRVLKDHAGRAPTPCEYAPPVLAGTPCSQYHGRHTFTQISHWGNLKAIDVMLGLPVGTSSKQQHWNPEEQTAPKLLGCLGSTELETLVAKLFEAKGCHVPAYMGGTLADIDLFAYNDTLQLIEVGDIKMQPAERVSIQVKAWKRIECPAGVDYLIGLDPVHGEKTRDAEWIFTQVKECSQVAAWLKRSLDWLPSEFTSRFGL